MCGIVVLACGKLFFLDGDFPDCIFRYFLPSCTLQTSDSYFPISFWLVSSELYFTHCCFFNSHIYILRFVISDVYFWLVFSNSMFPIVFPDCFSEVYFPNLYFSECKLWYVFPDLYVPIGRFQFVFPICIYRIVVSDHRQTPSDSAAEEGISHDLQNYR